MLSGLFRKKRLHEKFLAGRGAAPAKKLLNDILTNLAPHLLALAISRIDNPKDIDLTLRRLNERFEVKLATPLTVSFSLKDDHSISKSIEFPKVLSATSDN